jgi:hypothetical protein
MRLDAAADQLLVAQAAPQVVLRAPTGYRFWGPGDRGWRGGEAGQKARREVRKLHRRIFTDELEGFEADEPGPGCSIGRRGDRRKYQE